MFGLSPMELLVLGMMALVLLATGVWVVRNAVRKK
jgi:hypothetical protein